MRYSARSNRLVAESPLMSNMLASTAVMAAGMPLASTRLLRVSSAGQALPGLSKGQ